jgi:hypothetical protein
MSDTDETTLWNRIRKLEYDNSDAAARISKLEAALEEALEYFKDNYDVVDGDNGQGAPNKEMRIGQMIDQTLHGIQI